MTSGYHFEVFGKVCVGADCPLARSSRALELPNVSWCTVSLTTVSSQVQGVFFRASAADEAKRLRVVGWVRNTPTGSVEGEAQGSSQQLDTFRVLLQLRPCIG